MGYDNTTETYEEKSQNTYHELKKKEKKNVENLIHSGNLISIHFNTKGLRCQPI